MFRPKDRHKCIQLYQKYYSGKKFGSVVYQEKVKHYVRPGLRILDAGCGRHLTFSKELAGVAEVVGLDIDTLLETDNQESPFGVRGDLGCLPFPSGCFDRVISRSVIEHLIEPERVFREFHRVLRPKGMLIILTPNKYDYVSQIAAVTPHQWHQVLVSRIFDVSPDDVFPTFYRANTVSKLRELLAFGFQEQEMQTINHYPAYLMFSPLLFRLGVLVERVTSRETFRMFRGSILCVLEKSPVEYRPEDSLTA